MLYAKKEVAFMSRCMLHAMLHCMLQHTCGMHVAYVCIHVAHMLHTCCIVCYTVVCTFYCMLHCMLHCSLHCMFYCVLHCMFRVCCMHYLNRMLRACYRHFTNILHTSCTACCMYVACVLHCLLHVCYVYCTACMHVFGLPVLPVAVPCPSCSTRPSPRATPSSVHLFFSSRSTMANAEGSIGKTLLDETAFATA